MIAWGTRRYWRNAVAVLLAALFVGDAAMASVALPVAGREYVQLA